MLRLESLWCASIIIDGHEFASLDDDRILSGIESFSEGDSLAFLVMCATYDGVFRASETHTAFLLDNIRFILMMNKNPLQFSP